MLCLWPDGVVVVVVVIVVDDDVAGDIGVGAVFGDGGAGGGGGKVGWRAFGQVTPSHCKIGRLA